MGMSRCFACSRRVSHSESPGFRQLILGASKNGQLCIQPPSTSMPGTYGLSTDKLKDSPRKESFVTRIPDELLHDISTLSLGNDSNEQYLQSQYYHTALSLSTVSKHFHHILQPLMYRTINIGGHSLAQPCIAVKQLHRTMKENRALGSMVKTLRVHIDCLSTASEAEYKVATEILDLLPNVESFYFHGGFERPSTWPMIRNAIGNWARIKHVGLSREDFSLRMPPVCELVMATPNLMTLDLYGVYAFDGSSGTSTTSHAVWTPPSKDVERTCNITSLTIHDFGETPEALQNLLKLPRALERFAFGKIHWNPFHWRLDMFQLLLADHRTTLKSIEIGCLTSNNNPINFLEFPKLEILNLSHWVYRQTPEMAATSLLAPKLHTFIWDFRVIDQHSESWDDFGKEQKEWLIKFAKLATSRKSALRKIEIMFYPDACDDPRTKEELAVCVTPWELMDEVRNEISRLGIELVYNKGRTREECLQRIEEEEKWERSESGENSIRGYLQDSDEVESSN